MIRARRAGLESLLPCFVTSLVVLCLAGCQTPRLPGVPTRGRLLPLEAPEAQQRFADHLGLAAARVALRGQARVALEGPDFKLNRPMRIAVERPSRLRFEIVALFDQLAAILVTNGSRYQSYDAATGHVTSGRITTSLLWDLTKLDLEPAEAVALLLGAPVPSDGTRRAAVWEEPGGRLALAYAWPELDEVVAASSRADRCAGSDTRSWLDAACFLGREAARRALAEGAEVFVFDADGRLHELRALEADGLLRYRAVYEDYEALPNGATEAPSSGAVATADAGPLFAKSVTIHSPALDARARFEWKRVMLSGSLSDRLFSLPARLSGAR